MDVSEPRVVVTDSTQDSVAIGELQKQPDLPVGSESSAAVVNTTSSSGFAATVCSTSTSTSVVTSVSSHSLDTLCLCCTLICAYCDRGQGRFFFVLRAL